MWDFNPVALVYFFAACISFIVSFLAWKMRPTKGALHFSIMMLAVAVWIVANLLELYHQDLAWKVFFLKIGYTGMAFAVYTWFLFVTVYTQYDSWLSKSVLVVLAIIPVFNIVNVLMAPSPNFVHLDYTIVEANGLMVLRTSYGGAFYLWTSYAYSAIIGGLILLILRLNNMPKSQRNQIYLFIPAILVIIIPNVLYIIERNPIYPYDPTPLSMAIAGILFLISIHRHKFFDVLPVAHSMIFANMKSAVVVVDSRDKVQELNPAAQQIFNANDSNVLALDVKELIPETKHILEEQGLKDFRSEIEIVRIKQTFELKVSSLSDSRGKYTGRVLLFFDITEKIKAINELDAYARTVAHDLKNPLNVILGHANLLEAACKSQDNKDLCVSLEGIQQGALHMNDIVDSLLLLAKVRSVDHVKLDILNINEILESVLFRFQANIQDKNAELVINSSLPNALGVSMWVEQVWTNLISNAIKYGGNCPKIEIDSYVKKEMAYFTVKDSGKGLTEEQQENVFVEFTRLPQHDTSIIGHGLGLSIVKRVVEKLGGQVGVESEPNKGSTFYFSLPVVK